MLRNGIRGKFTLLSWMPFKGNVLIGGRSKKVFCKKNFFERPPIKTFTDRGIGKGRAVLFAQQGGTLLGAAFRSLKSSPRSAFDFFGTFAFFCAAKSATFGFVSQKQASYDS